MNAHFAWYPCARGGGTKIKVVEALTHARTVVIDTTVADEASAMC